MTVQEILTTTKSLKVDLWCEGDKLKYNAPQGVLTDEIRANLQRLKPELLKLLQSVPPHRWSEQVSSAPAVTASDINADERARGLLARYRRGGALLELETVEHEGALWLSLACDLSGVVPGERDRAFEQMRKHARQIQRALELEVARMTIINAGEVSA